MGGRVCQSVHGNNCTFTSSVELLDVSAGAWKPFPVPLGKVVDYPQFATLDHELGAWQRMNGTVNDRLSDECGYSTTTTTPPRATTQDERHACIALVLDESDSIVAAAFRQAGSFKQNV